MSEPSQLFRSVLPHLVPLVVERKNAELKAALSKMDSPLVLSQEHLKWVHDAFVASISCDNIDGLMCIWQWVEGISKRYHLATFKYLWAIDPVRPPASLLGSLEPFVYFAVRHGRVAPLRFFLSLPNLNLNVADSHGWTVLILACRLGHTEIAEMLMDRGASPFVTDLNGNSAICAAILSGHAATASQIIKSSQVKGEELKRYLMGKMKQLKVPANPSKVQLERQNDQRRILAFLDKNPLSSKIIAEIGLQSKPKSTKKLTVKPIFYIGSHPNSDVEEEANIWAFGKPADPILQKIAKSWHKEKMKTDEKVEKPVVPQKPTPPEPRELAAAIQQSIATIKTQPQDDTTKDEPLEDLDGPIGPFCGKKAFCYACQPWNELKPTNGCHEDVAPLLALFYAYQNALMSISRGGDDVSQIQLVSNAEKLMEDMVELQKCPGRTSVWNETIPLPPSNPTVGGFSVMSKVQLPRVNCRRYTPLHLHLKKLLEMLPDYCEVIASGSGILFMPKQEDRYVIGTCEEASKFQSTRMILALFETTARRGEKMGVVVKKLPKNELADRCVRRLKDFSTEVLQMVDAHLIYYRVVESPTLWYLARDPCDWNLDEYIQSFKGHGAYMFTAKRHFTEMVKGLDYLHRKLPVLFHGNLKPSNLLIDSNHVLRLVDFCFGRLFTPNHNVTNQQCRLENGMLDARCWKPVEYYTVGVQYNAKSDVHAAASLAYYMLTEGRGHPFLPFSGKDGASLDLLRNNLIRNFFIIDRVEPLAQELLGMMLANEQVNRPNCSAVLSHPFCWSPTQQHLFLVRIADVLSSIPLSSDIDLDKKVAEVLRSVPYIRYGEVDILTSKAQQSAANWKDQIPAEIWTEPTLSKEDFSEDLLGLLKFIRFCDDQQDSTRKSLLAFSTTHQAEFFLATYPQLFSTVFMATCQSHLKSHPILTKYFAKYDRLFVHT